MLSKYKDINGRIIESDDVLWDGECHWSYQDETHHNGEFIISCEYGYIHELSQQLFTRMKYVGKHQDCLHLFHCD